MLKENLSPKQILVDLSSVQCQLKDLFSDDNRYNSIIDFLSAKDYYNDPDIPFPTMKEVKKDTGLSASQLRKKLLEMYERIFDFENDEGLRFSKTQYTFYLKHYELHSQFVVSKLHYVPRVGEEILLPFAKAKMGIEYFYVDKIVHYLENDIQNTVIWLKGGFYKRGLLVKKSVYAVENNLPKLVEQTIIDKDTDYDFIEGNNIRSYDLVALECKHKVFYDKYVNYVNKFPEYPMICQSSSEPGIYGPCFSYDNCTEVAPFVLSSQQIRPGRAEVKKSTTTYYPDGSSNGITKTTYYTYNPENYQLASEAYTINEGSALTEYKTVYEYPVGGYTSSLFESTDVTAINKMVALNIINKPITISSYKNGTLLQRVVNKYKDFSTSQVLLSQVETLKNGSATIGEDRIIYSSYGPKNNIQDVTKANGIPVSYIWGYNHTVPVAKIDGLAYSSLPVNERTAIENASSETALRTALQALHYYFSNGETQVSTFLTDPVKGVIETVDSRGYKLKYTYDILGRLTKVTDETGKIISEYEYKYRGLF